MVIGVTGGIASGKSIVCRMFEDLGGRVINADIVGHEILMQPDVRDQLVQTFGNKILAPDGAIDRPALGRIVFSDADARERLNAMTHPPILSEIRRRIGAIHAAGFDGVIVVEAPVLIEANGVDIVDKLINVVASESRRMAWLMARNGYPDHVARQRISSQLSDKERNRWAHYVIENDGDIEALEEKARALWRLVTGGKWTEGQKKEKREKGEKGE